MVIFVQHQWKTVLLPHERTVLLLGVHLDGGNYPLVEWKINRSRRKQQPMKKWILWVNKLCPLILTTWSRDKTNFGGVANIHNSDNEGH